MADVVGRAELELILNANTNQIEGQLKTITTRLDQSLGTAAQNAGKKAEGAFTKVSDALGKGVGGALDIVESGFKTLATVGVGALAGLFGTSVKLGLSFQELSQKVNAGLKSVLGVAGADQVFSDLNALATGTSSAMSSIIEESKGVKKSFEEIGPSPFPREEFFKAAQQLAGFGIEAKKIPAIINAVQQAVAGVGGSAQDIGELTSIFANISAQGKITGQDIQRLGIRGINAAQILSKAFGVSAGKIKEDSSVIQASSADVIDALQKGLIEQFPNATKNLGNTLDQVVDKFRSARRNIGRALVEPFVGSKSGGAAVVLLGQMDQALESLAKVLTSVVTPLIQKFADKIVRLAEPLFQFNRSIKETGDALRNSTNPFIQFLAKIAGTGTLLEGITKKIGSLVDGFKGFGPVLAGVTAAFGGFATQFLSAIPGIGPILAKLTGGLTGFRGGIIGLALAIPQVREQILKIAQALITALLPAFNAVKAVIPVLTDAVGKAAAALGPALISVIVALAPLLTTIANAVAKLIIAVAPLIPLIAEGLAKAIESVIPLLTTAVTAISGFIDKVVGGFQALKGVDLGSVFTGLVGSATGLGPVLTVVGPALEKVFTLLSGLDFSTVVDQVKGLADQFGILQPIMIAVSVAAAAFAAAMAVIKVSAAEAAVAEALQTGVTTALAAAESIAAVVTGDLAAATAALEGTVLAAVSPFVLIAAIVAAVAAAFVILYLKVQPVRDAVDNLVDAIGNTLAPVIQSIKDNIEVFIVAALVPLAIAFAPIIASIAAVIIIIRGLVEVFKALQPLLGPIVNLIGVVLVGAFKALGVIIDFLGSHIEIVLAAAFIALLPVIGPLIGVLAALFLGFKVLVGVINVVVAVILQVASVIASAVNPVFNALQVIIGIVVSIVKASLIPALVVLSPILLAIAAAVGLAFVAFKVLQAVLGAIAGVIRAAIGLFEGLAQIVGVVVGAVAGLVQGVVQGIGGAFAAVIRAAIALFEGLVGIVGVVAAAILDLGDRVFGGLIGVVGTIIGLIGNLIGKFAEFGPVKAIIDGIGSAFSAAADIIQGVIDKMGKVKGLLNKLSFGKLFKDTKKDAEDTKKAIDGIPAVAAKIAPAFTAAQTAASGTFTAIQGIRDELAKVPDAAKNLESIQGIAKSIDPVLAAAEKAKSANQAVITANSGLAEATKRINDLQKERAKILRDTISPAHEIAAAERDLTAARFKLTEIDKQVIATQKELNDFRAFGRAEQEASLDRDLERAKIAANKARRDEAALLAAVNKEKDKGNQETQLDINLAGLTLDQARAKLAAVRSTLAAQQQGKKTEQGNTAEVKSQQEIEDEKKSAALDVADAEQRQRDAERAQAAFKDQADTKEAELSQQLVDLAGQKIVQQDAINAQQQHLNDLRNGETTLALALRDIDKQILDAKRAQAEAATRVRDAVRAARDAEREAAIQAALYTNQQQKAADLIKQQLVDRAGLLTLEPQVRDQLTKSLAPLQAGIDKAKELSGQIAQLGQQAVDQAKGLKGLFDESVGDAGKTAALLDNGSLPNLLLDAANKALTANPDDPFAKAVKDILLNLFAQRFSGAEGGMIADHFKGIKQLKPGYLPGGAGPDGRLFFAQLGEYGRGEAVLPLHDAFNMTRVLQDKRVLHPVLETLGRITLPKAPISSVGSSSRITSLSSSSRIAAIKGSGGQQVGGRMQKQREQRDFAKMIAEELVGAGFEGNITVEAPVTVEGSKLNEELMARRLEQRIVKIIEGRLR